jgi:hypothetical protein
MAPKAAPAVGSANAKTRSQSGIVKPRAVEEVIEKKPATKKSTAANTSKPRAKVATGRVTKKPAAKKPAAKPAKAVKKAAAKVNGAVEKTEAKVEKAAKKVCLNLATSLTRPLLCAHC